jgi:hypothetical protein
MRQDRGPSQILKSFSTHLHMLALQLLTIIELMGLEDVAAVAV